MTAFAFAMHHVQGSRHLLPQTARAISTRAGFSDERMSAAPTRIAVAGVSRTVRPAFPRASSLAAISLSHAMFYICSGMREASR